MIERPMVEPDVLRELGAIAVELTRLRQNECKHLAVENCGPEIFGKLLEEYRDVVHPIVHITHVPLSREGTP